MLDRLADVGSLLPDGFELPCQLRARAAGHVAADHLGLVSAIEAAPFVEDVARGSPEAAPSGDLGNHAAPPSGLRVVPSPSARTVPTNRVTSSRASRTSGAPGSRRRSVMRLAMALMSAASLPSAWYVSRLTSGIGRTARRGGSGRERTAWRMYVDRLMPRSRATSATWSLSPSVRRTGTMASRRGREGVGAVVLASGASSESKSVRDMVTGILQSLY